MLKLSTPIPKYVADYGYIKSNGVVLKNYVIDQLAVVEQGASAKRFEGIIIQLERFATEFSARNSTPGLLEFAEFVEGAGYGLVAEIDAVIVAIIDVGGAIRAGIPLSADGYLMVDKLGDDGKKVSREFSVLESAPVATALAALLALLD